MTEDGDAKKTPGKRKRRNKAKQSEYNKRYYKLNRDRIVARKKKYRAEHRDLLREKKREFLSRYSVLPVVLSKEANAKVFAIAKHFGVTASSVVRECLRQCGIEFQHMRYDKAIIIDSILSTATQETQP